MWKGDYVSFSRNRFWWCKDISFPGAAAATASAGNGNLTRGNGFDEISQKCFTEVLTSVDKVSKSQVWHISLKLNWMDSPKFQGLLQFYSCFSTIVAAVV